MRKSVGKDAVETRLLNICDSRGEESLSGLRETARSFLASPLCFDKEFKVLDEFVGGVSLERAPHNSRRWPARRARRCYPTTLTAWHCSKSLQPLYARSPVRNCRSGGQRTHLAFLDVLLELHRGDEFEIEEARAFVLEGKPIEDRPKDSHDILGVFRRAGGPAWRNQVLAIGEPVVVQLQAPARRPDRLPARKSIRGNSRSRSIGRATPSSYPARSGHAG